MSPSSRSPVLVLLLAGVLATGASFAADDAPPVHKAKQALDDRADPNAVSGNDVGKGTHMGAKATQPGTYIGDKSREAVRRYYAEHPPTERTAAAWQIGEPLPRGAKVSAVPAPLLASLPKAPPGVHYVRTGGDILLVAGSGMVVDGVKAP